MMIAPNYWVDRHTGNDYFLTVQFYESGRPSIHTPFDFDRRHSYVRSANLKKPTTLDTVVKLENIRTPTVVNHYKIQRVSPDVYVTPKARRPRRRNVTRGGHSQKYPPRQPPARRNLPHGQHANRP